MLYSLNVCVYVLNRSTPYETLQKTGRVVIVISLACRK